MSEDITRYRCPTCNGSGMHGPIPGCHDCGAGGYVLEGWVDCAPEELDEYKRQRWDWATSPHNFAKKGRWSSSARGEALFRAMEAVDKGEGGVTQVDIYTARIDDGEPRDIKRHLFTIEEVE